MRQRKTEEEKREANRLRQAQWYQRNKEKQRDYQQKWREKNRETHRAQVRVRQARHRAKGIPEAERERAREYAREYYQNNKQKVRAGNDRWRANNPERSKELNRKACVRSRQRNPAKYLWHCAKGRSKKFGIPFDLTPEDIVIPEFCPALGVPMKQLTGPFSPSLDRIRPELGYVKGNVAVICARANLMKNDSTDPAELRRVADWFEAQLMEVDDGV